MNFFNRLKKLEEFWADDGRMSEADSQTELLREFAKSSPENGAVLDRCAGIVQTLNAVRLIRHPECGELRRALGDYCREKRYRFPGASVVRCYRGVNIVAVGGDGKLLQIFASQPIPTLMENQQ